MVKPRAAWATKLKQESRGGKKEGKLGGREIGEKGFSKLMASLFFAMKVKHEGFGDSC